MKIKDFLKSGHPPTLFSAFLYFDISFMVWVLMGVLGVFIAQDYGLSPLQKGFLASVPLLGGSLVRIPLGILVDHIGPKKTGIVAQIIVLAPLAGVWLFADSLPVLLTLGLLLGVAGGSFAVSLPLASRWYPPQHQGMALGIAGAGNSGTVLASLFAPSLAQIVGWKAVFGLALIPAVLTLLVFSWMAKESPDRPAPKKITSYLSILRERDALWFCFFYSVTFGGFVGLASFLGIFFHDQYGLERIHAGYFTAFCVAAGSFLRPVGGYLSDRFGGIRVLSVLFGMIALLMMIIGFLPPFAWTLALLFLVMMCMGMGNGSVFQLVPLRFRNEIGVMTGIVGAAGGLGGFFLPTILGSFKQTIGSYGAGFFVFGVVGAAALAALRVAQKEWDFGREVLTVKTEGLESGADA